MNFLSNLKKHLVLSRRTTSVPDGTLAYAIGDIHGRADLLETLLNLIEKDATLRDASRHVLVFLGDYVDRGWQSKEVLERLCTLKIDGFETVFLKGNHEEALLTFLDDPLFLESWRQYGGLETLHAYGLKDLNFQADEEYMRAVHKQFENVFPASHKEFLKALPISYELGDYFFVHAGVRPGVPLDQQNERDLCWIRDEFLESNMNFGKRVVHGHCPEEEPQVRKNRIGVDTGAYITGTLTAVVLEETNVRFLKTAD